MGCLPCFTSWWWMHSLLLVVLCCCVFTAQSNGGFVRLERSQELALDDAVERRPDVAPFYLHFCVGDGCVVNACGNPACSRGEFVLFGEICYSMEGLIYGSDFSSLIVMECRNLPQINCSAGTVEVSFFSEPRCRKWFATIGYWGPFCSDRNPLVLNGTSFNDGFTGMYPSCSTTTRTKTTSVRVTTPASTTTIPSQHPNAEAFLYAGLSVIGVGVVAAALCIAILCHRRRRKRASYQQV